MLSSTVPNFEGSQKDYRITQFYYHGVWSLWFSNSPKFIISFGCTISYSLKKSDFVTISKLKVKDLLKCK